MFNSTSHKTNTTQAGNHFPLHFEDLLITSASLNNILGLPLNGYVMWLILAKAKKDLASDFFYLNLAMCEIFFSLSSIWYFVYVPSKLFLCFNAFMFSRGLLITARPLFQCCISAECYVGVIHPVLFLRLKPLRYRMALCCVAWSITLVSCIYCLFAYQTPLSFYVLFIQNILSFIVVLFCCLSVLRALKSPGPGKKEKEMKSNKMKRRAFTITLLVMTCMVLNFSFSMVAMLLQCCLQPAEFIKASIICTSLAMMTGFVQPMLYLRRTGKLPCLREL